MKRILYLMVAILIFIAGLLFGRILFLPNEEVKKAVEHQCPQTVPSDCRSELAQAQEYYGKAFLLFLSNIGLRLSPSQNDLLLKVVESPSAYLEDSAGRPTTTDVVIAPEQDNELKESLSKSTTETNQDEKRGPKMRAKQFELEKPMSFFEGTRLLEKNNKQLLKVNGQYEGKLFIESGKRKGEIHQVELNIEYSLEASKAPEGQYFLQISSDEGPYSTNSGSGSNADIRLHPDQPRAIILSASPSSFFHFANSELTIANFYDDGKFVGAAVFKRK